MNWRGKNNPHREVVYSLLQELARRDGLTGALSGRNEKELYPILLFTRFSILEPKYSSFMLDVFDMILGENLSSLASTYLISSPSSSSSSSPLPPPPPPPPLSSTASPPTDIYGDTLYQSKSISGLLRLVKGKIERELEFQRRGFQLLGAIDALLTAATATNKHTPSSTVTNGYKTPSDSTPSADIS